MARRKLGGGWNHGMKEAWGRLEPRHEGSLGEAGTMARRKLGGGWNHGMKEAWGRLEPRHEGSLGEAGTKVVGDYSIEYQKS